MLKQLFLHPDLLCLLSLRTLIFYALNLSPLPHLTHIRNNNQKTVLCILIFAYLDFVEEDNRH
jgi:hypothetical protein